MDNSMIGKTLQNGKYKIMRVLGQGGFGITYEGVQTGLNRRVAIKEFFMEDYCEREEGTSQVTIVGTKGNRELVKRFREKFVKEAQLIAGLEDVPHIIRIHDVFEENGTAYYVMQFIEGGSLKDLVKQKGKLDEATAVRYISQVADALSALHQRRIMHLDVKPDNILLKDDEAVLIDFGVSKHYDKEGNATTTTPVGRSKGYAPLEQYKQGGVSEFSPETDIYSLGATLYFLITGKNPPEATELVTNPIQCPSFLSSNINMAISQTMKPSKAYRLHSTRDFVKLIVNNKVIDKERNENEETIIDRKEESNTTSHIKKNSKKTVCRQLSYSIWFYLMLAIYSITFVCSLFAIYRVFDYYSNSDLYSYYDIENMYIGNGLVTAICIAGMTTSFLFIRNYLRLGMLILNISSAIAIAGAVSEYVNFDITTIQVLISLFTLLFIYFKKDSFLWQNRNNRKTIVIDTIAIFLAGCEIVVCLILHIYFSLTICFGILLIALYTTFLLWSKSINKIEVAPDTKKGILK